jgi:membrane protein/epoxyqueuosine reductase
VAGHFARVTLRRLRRPLPLVHTLLFSIETHALCGALAFFAMLGFYPLSVLLISLAKYVLRSPDAHEVVRLAVQSYYPAGQEFVLRNLEASSWQFRSEISISLALWIFLGGAGIFIPLEMAFNRLWGFAVHRSYWHNQLVGLLLTAAFWAIAVGLVLAVSRVPRPVRGPALWLAVPALAAVALFLAYKLLPHGPVPGGIALGAAALTAGAAEVVRWIFLLVLPRLDLSRSHGPFQVSVSFLLFAYVEAYVLLAGAFLAAEATRERLPPREGIGIG